MKRDLFGFERLYRAGDRFAPRIRTLLGPDRRLDMVAVDAHLAGTPVTERTMFAAVQQVPPSYSAATPGQRGDLLQLLRAAVTRILEEAPGRVAVALSGGLDSAVVLALVHEVDPTVPAITLAPQLPDYSELDAVIATIRRDGRGELLVKEVTEDDYRDALPAAITAFETPLYNLHPVSKYLLAGEAKWDRIQTVISGDGIDQVFTRDVSADYLPLASAAFEAQGVALRTPFLDDHVVAHVLSLPPDPDKRALREVAATLRLLPDLVNRPKVSRLAPPIELDLSKTSALGELLGRMPSLNDDRDIVRWTTLAMVLDSFQAWP